MVAVLWLLLWLTSGRSWSFLTVNFKFCILYPNSVATEISFQQNFVT